MHILIKNVKKTTQTNMQFQSFDDCIVEFLHHRHCCRAVRCTRWSFCCSYSVQNILWSFGWWTPVLAFVCVFDLQRQRFGLNILWKNLWGAAPKVANTRTLLGRVQTMATRKPTAIRFPWCFAVAVCARVCVSQTFYNIFQHIGDAIRVHAVSCTSFVLIAQCILHIFDWCSTCACVRDLVFALSQAHLLDLN